MMEDRLTQCLNEVIYSDDCSAELRSILQNVLELNDRISVYDVNDFEDYLQSEDFVGDMYELFGVDLFGSDDYEED